jgi:hypothetical protein
VNGLVKADPFAIPVVADEPVFDRRDRPDDRAVDSRLLAHLALRCHVR